MVVESARSGRTARPEQGRLRGAAVPGYGPQPAVCLPCRLARPPWNCWHGPEDALPQRRRPESCAAPNGSGRSSRRSRNTMRVKPYAIRSPSRNARQTALRAPGGSISTSGCSCRYRSSLRTWFGGPGGTSCTGQYRCPVSGPRNRLLKTRATRRRYRYPPPTWTRRRPLQTGHHHYMRSRRQAVPPTWLTRCRYHQTSNSLTPER
jgi:hypothetical protein